MKRNACSLCGQGGHRNYTCPQRPSLAQSPATPSAPKRAYPATRKPAVVLPYRAPAVLPPKPPKLSVSEKRGERKLTQHEFSCVKELAKGDVPSPNIARGLDLPLQQVNYAILTRDYAHYEIAYARV